MTLLTTDLGPTRHGLNAAYAAGPLGLPAREAGYLPWTPAAAAALGCSIDDAITGGLVVRDAYGLPWGKRFMLMDVA